MVARILLLLPVLALVACTDDPCPRGSMVDSAEGLIVTQEEHPTGWGDIECSACHVHARLHRIGCTPDVDLLHVRAEVDDQGDNSCDACHGDNGTGASNDD